ncbi:ABC transporter permease [Rhodospirillaceae bacterium]|jgi:spermidine/putrescine transport system permease protein|nr:ABC transporter permease [Rhodospirillaceae bacterium]MDC0998465.1 ABC transporter permease [Alphaproteobacteria bacterium]MDC1441411.1 ABC transporter permease [Rhodospirillaceae bacterium]
MKIKNNDKAPKVSLDYFYQWWFKVILCVTFIFLYAPILVLIIFSFNDSRRNITWRGFTLKYYEKAALNDGLIDAFINSLTIGIFNTLGSLILGILTALLLWRFRFPFKALYEGIILLPVVMPEICIGVALLVFFNQIGWANNLPWPLSLSKITFAHILFSFPFVAIIIRARLATFNLEQEEAAFDLGASPGQVFTNVFLPHIRPALIVSGLIAFTLSLDDFVITFFTSGPDTITVPIKIYSMVRFSVTPEVNAASTILLLITLCAAGIALWVHRAKISRIGKL